MHRGWGGVAGECREGLKSGVEVGFGSVFGSRVEAIGKQRSRDSNDSLQSAGVPAVHVAFVSSVARWWGCARPLTRELWRWESSVRCGVRVSVSGGDTGSGADVTDTVGAVGFALIFHSSLKKEQNFSATGSGFPVTSLQNN
jgi:hypothetical protein